MKFEFPSEYTPKVIRGNCFEVASDFRDVDLVVTDPPYGRIVNKAWDKNWTYEDQSNVGKLIEKILKPGGTAYVWGGVGRPKDRLFLRWLSYVEDETSLKLHNVITWKKKRGIGTQYNYLFTREECAMLVKGDRPVTFNVPLLDEIRGYAGYDSKYPALSDHYRRTNVFTDINEIFRGKKHVNEKPRKLSEVLIETSSKKDELVVDLFAGSGSTGVAAKGLSRRSILIEMSDCWMYQDPE